MHQASICRASAAFAYRLRDDQGSRVRCDMDHLCPSIEDLPSVCEGDRQHLAVGAVLHQPNGWVLHRKSRTEVAIDPFHRRVLVCGCTFRDEVQHIVRPVLDRRVAAPATLLDDDLYNRRVERVSGVRWSGAPFDIVAERPFINDDQCPLELTHALSVDPEVCLERLLEMHARRYVDEGPSRPHG